MENFEYESCREFRILHFSFQAPVRLRLRSKVNFLIFSMFELGPVRLGIQNFLPFLGGTRKNHQHRSCSTFRTLQVLFQENVQLRHGLKVILNLTQQRV